MVLPTARTECFPTSMQVKWPFSSRYGDFPRILRFFLPLVNNVLRTPLVLAGKYFYPSGSHSVEPSQMAPLVANNSDFMSPLCSTGSADPADRLPRPVPPPNTRICLRLCPGKPVNPVGGTYETAIDYYHGSTLMCNTGQQQHLSAE